jgi:hypothetical protein
MLWKIYGTWFEVEYKKVNKTSIKIITCVPATRLLKSEKNVGFIREGTNKITFSVKPKILTFIPKEEYTVINYNPKLIKESEYYLQQDIENSGFKIYSSKKEL